MARFPAYLYLAILCVPAWAGAEPTPQDLVVTTSETGDHVELQVADAAGRLTVRSATGIGQAVISRAGGRWPDRLTVRLHLQGLEDLSVSNGSTLLGASVSSTGPATVRTTQGSDALPIADDSPWKMSVRVVDNGREATAIPLADGYIEIELPPALWESNPEAITIRWIDFYRG